MEITLLIRKGLASRPARGWFREVTARVLEAEGAASGAEVSLVITGQEEIRRLNREYRGKDRPTDVLSFSLAEQGEMDTPFIDPPDGLRHLGEVVISCPQAAIQAQARHHSPKKELAVLITHGVLHLLGYDHGTPKE